MRTAVEVCRPVEITVSPWILNRNGIVPDDARMEARSLASIHMPNRDGFVPDSQPGRL
jgi:S-disulfanyl-L-cysteine oxidoreductase SoxD